MECTKVCRICLVTDVSMHDLQAFPLGTYFENVTGINLFKMTDLPPFACYDCTAMIKKYNTFRERCLRGQAALYGILQTSGKISIEDVKQIDRIYFHLTSNITFSSTKIQEDFSINYEDSKKNIKNEPFEQTDNILEYNIELNINSIKEESNFDDFLSMSSDDNEPLSIHKSDKQKKKVKIVKRKARKKRNNEECTETSENSLGESLNETEEKDSSILQGVLKRKRGRPKKNTKPEEKLRKCTNSKNELEIEEYATVITLSLEQQIQEVEKRKTSSNYLNSVYKCELCYKGFVHTDAWQHHLGKHDPSAGDIECGVCKFRFKTRRGLLKHAINHEKKYACKACTYVSRNTTQAKHHQRWHKGVTYKCQYCDEISTSVFNCPKERLVESKGDEGGGKRELYCAECEVQFVSEAAWRRHLVTSVKHVPSYIFNNGCRVCGDTFANPEELRIHHRQKHAIKRPTNYGKKPSKQNWPANCEHCSEEICNAREYWVHFRRVHPDKNYPVPKNHICDVCGKGFRVK
ncbi:PREDICTED: zinc finger protein 62-like [Papilio polytes]|uniref:zinc finger protein 62-like n=1 Tax=Papilio polytes TaxID=76194 RepID=UPI0006766FD8|nr:PREDICTED: zinc finger protein 62-like [Papilio polytes]